MSEGEKFVANNNHIHCPAIFWGLILSRSDTSQLRKSEKWASCDRRVEGLQGRCSNRMSTSNFLGSILIPENVDYTVSNLSWFPSITVGTTSIMSINMFNYIAFLHTFPSNKIHKQSKRCAVLLCIELIASCSKRFNYYKYVVFLTLCSLKWRTAWARQLVS